MQQSAKKLYTLAEIIGEPISEEEILNILKSSPNTYSTYLQIKETYREKLLSFLQGKCGLTITYDVFFKKIMDAYNDPARLESFLSAILGQQVKIIEILPLEGIRLSESGSLVIMDITVLLSDGTIVDVEIQKLGYLFPGERCDCYTADFIMRQYNRRKSEQGDNFSYKDMKPVLLIVIMEKSSAEFAAVSPAYIHQGTRIFDTGANVNSLSKTIYISLDTFHSVVHNITNMREAWLTFFSSDNPDEIIDLVNTYPEFLQYYHEIAMFRKNPKELVYMFSEALAIADRNTAILTYQDRYEQELKKNVALAAELTSTIADKDAAIADKDIALADKDIALANKDATIAALQAEIEKLKQQ